MAASGSRGLLRRQPRCRVRLPLGGRGVENCVSTVQEFDPPRRIVWSGPAQGINAIHVWEFTQTDHGVLVHTEESWDGEPVRAQAGMLQPLLDAAIRAWLSNLKHAAEQAAQRL
jgi:hypothetical protein